MKMNKKGNAAIFGVIIFILLIVIAALLAWALGYIQINKNTGNNEVKNETQLENLTCNIVSELEEAAIKEYIEKIYRRHETSMPEFDDINDADPNWLWGVVFDNCKNSNTIIEGDRPYTASIDNMISTAEELFGKMLNVRPSQTGSINFIEYDSKNQLFIEIGRGGSRSTPKCVVSSINKNNDVFTVCIIKYIYDKPTIVEENEKDEISLYNNDTKVVTFSNSETIDYDAYVLENKDKFKQSELTIKVNSGKCNLISCKAVK